MMVVAIDGPAGAGKSTIAACASHKIGFLYINSGNFYRSISKAVLDLGLNPERKSDIIKTARECNFKFRDKRFYLNQVEVQEDIHSDLIDKWVSFHSSIPEVREIVNRDLRRIAKKRDIIVEGRDMGTVVFPDADVKIFLDANLKTRTLRRFRQGVSRLSEEEIMKSLKDRDYLDRNKPVGRLEKAQDARYIDASDLTIDQVCEKVVQEIRKKIESIRS